MSCPECFTGHVMNDYVPKGELTTLHGRKTYVARPADGKTVQGIIIIIPDAFGIDFPNNKHLADTFAEKGSFLTYLPDFMNGAPVPSTMVDVFPNLFKTASLSDWLWKPYYISLVIWNAAPFMIRNSFAKAMPNVAPFFEAVRENEAKNLKVSIGCAGYCWGGPFTFALASGKRKTASGQVLCDAHFTAHPSNLTLPDCAKDVTLPLSLAHGTEDMVLKTKQAEEIEAIFKEKSQKDGLKHSEVVYYQGAGHGFGVRADPGNKEVVKHAAASVEQAINFYQRVFASIKH